jgi:hypothetical protein
MADRKAVSTGLVELRTWWPSLPDTAVLLDSVADACIGYTDDEFSIAVRRLTREHKAGWPPKLAEIVAMCGAVASIRRADAVASRRANTEDAYCPQCGTTVLEWSAPWPIGKSRMVPRHEPGCPRYGAEAVTAAPVNMASWPSLKPRHVDEKPSGAVALAAAIAIPGGASPFAAPIPPSPVSYQVSTLPEAHRGA